MYSLLIFIEFDFCAQQRNVPVYFQELFCCFVQRLSSDAYECLEIAVAQVVA
jgi:hypothetical protein